MDGPHGSMPVYVHAQDAATCCLNRELSFSCLALQLNCKRILQPKLHRAAVQRLMKLQCVYAATQGLHCKDSVSFPFEARSC